MSGSRYIADQIKAENKQMILNKANVLKSRHENNLANEKKLLQTMRVNDNDEIRAQMVEE